MTIPELEKALAKIPATGDINLARRKAITNQICAMLAAENEPAETTETAETE